MFSFCHNQSCCGHAPTGFELSKWKFRLRLRLLSPVGFESWVGWCWFSFWFSSGGDGARGRTWYVSTKWMSTRISWLCLHRISSDEKQRHWWAHVSRTSWVVICMIWHQQYPLPMPILCMPKCLTEIHRPSRHWAAHLPDCSPLMTMSYKTKSERACQLWTDDLWKRLLVS